MGKHIPAGTSVEYRPDLVGHEADAFTSGVIREALRGREDELRGLFSGFGAMSAAERAYMGKHFNAPASRRSQAHSVLLGNTEAETLSEKVRGLRIK